LADRAVKRLMALRGELLRRSAQSMGTARSSRLTAVALVFIVAALNGTAWSLLTPPFQVPDETAHFAYSQTIAETGSGPGILGRPEFSSEQDQAMAAMGTLEIIGRPLVHAPVASQTVRNAIQAAAEGAPRGNGGGPSSASSQPPLYYALEALPYRAFSWATLPTRLYAMRAVSVLIFAFGAALAALLAAEILRGRAWVPLVGGMAVALSPYTAFVASGVTPDTLLLTISVATVLLVARAFRRGFTRRRAVAIGLMVGAGTLTKLTFLAFLPPALLVVIVLVIRDHRSLAVVRGGPLGSLLVALIAAAVLPVAASLWTEIAAHGNSARTGAFEIAVGSEETTSIREVVVYGWELFLPRLPFMSDQFTYFPPVTTWIDGFAGRYGWLDYEAPAIVIMWHRAFLATVGILAGCAVVASRHAVCGRRLEFASYAAFGVAQAAVIAKTGFDYRRSTGYVFEQPRYLFGLAGFYGALIAVSCIGLGDRLAPRLATIAVGLFCLHDMSGLTTTMLRYYG